MNPCPTLSSWSCSTPVPDRLVRTVDAITDDQWRQPSLLPGWTRAHVVAHLTLNAEGLSGALEGVHEGRPVPMYASRRPATATSPS